jgi:hypothetical protein
MAPFEALYGQQCCTLLNWIEPGEKAIFGPDIVVEAEATIRRIQGNLKVAKLHQESYANKRRRPLQFEARDHVYLKVSPMKGVKRFGVTGKLSPRYIEPFPILEKCGKVAYKLELPPSLAGVHDIFHVPQLKKCLKAPMDVVLPEVAPLDTDMTYPEHLIKILDQRSHVTRRRMIKFFFICGILFVHVSRMLAQTLFIIRVNSLSRLEGWMNCNRLANRLIEHKSGQTNFDLESWK